jgi:hypothetical protein
MAEDQVLVSSSGYRTTIRAVHPDGFWAERQSLGARNNSTHAQRLDAIRRAFESADVEFIDQNGAGVAAKKATAKKPATQR